VTHAYDRFWSGRKLWQSLADGCRNGARRAVSWCTGGAEGEAAGRDIAAHFLLLVAATDARLRSSARITFSQSLSAVVPRASLLAVESASHPPLACAHITGQRILKAQLDGYLTEERSMELERGLAEMLASAGACDAIARTPTPFEYSAHTSRFLTLFVFTLPLVLAPTMGLWTVPASSLVAYALLAIDEISAVVEAPFAGYLPMKELFAALRLDVTPFLPETTEHRSSRLA
jgi:putative membrane protein